MEHPIKIQITGQDSQIMYVGEDGKLICVQYHLVDDMGVDVVLE
jgi:hypothetical protein